MKIVLLTRRFPPECCGVGDYTAQLARALTERGDEVVVFTQPAAGPRPTGIRVVELPLRGWRDLRGTLDAICAENPARVQLEYSNYGWGRWGFAFWLNALVAALRVRRVAVTAAFHEFPLEFRQHPLQTGIAVIQRIHFWLLAACAGEVVTNTRERIRILRRWFPRGAAKFHYRPNSSTIPVTPISLEEREGIRASHGALSGTLVVAVFGMFQAGKNYEAVIEAVARVRQGRAVQLWVLGNWQAASPAYVEGLRLIAHTLQIEKECIWTGHLPEAQVSAHLLSADLFVLPQPDGHLTRSSAFMAAASHGLPVIAVRNEENQREFTHGGNVWLVERSTAGDFERALQAVGADVALRQVLQRGLRKLYEQQFQNAAVRSIASGPSGAPLQNVVPKTTTDGSRAL